MQDWKDTPDYVEESAPLLKAMFDTARAVTPPAYNTDTDIADDTAEPDLPRPKG